MKNQQLAVIAIFLNSVIYIFLYIWLILFTI
jgi:hypothetical protein